MPELNQRAAGGDEFAGEALQSRRIHGPLLQQGIPRAKGPRVTLQQGQISRVSLREKQVEEPAPAAGRAFHQLQVLGAKNHRAQHPEIVNQLANRTSIQGQLPLLRRPVHLDLVGPLADHPPTDEVSFLSVPNHLRAPRPSEGTKRGHQINGFQNVGLSLGVISNQQVKAW